MTNDARIRFITKRVQVGPRSFRWRVYDVPRASFPYLTNELGKVKQDVTTEREAQAECDRLGAMAEWPKAGALKASDYWRQ